MHLGYIIRLYNNVGNNCFGVFFLGGVLTAVNLPHCFSGVASGGDAGFDLARSKKCLIVSVALPPAANISLLRQRNIG